MADSTNNNVVTSDFLRVLLTLKQNIFRDLHVATVGIVTSSTLLEEGVTTYTCNEMCNSKMQIDCYALEGLTLTQNDVVLILFVDNDFRQNYKRLKLGQQTIDMETKNLHAMSYGIIIGKL